MQIVSEILAQLINFWVNSVAVLEYQSLALNECVKLTVISFHFKFNGNIWNIRIHSD